MTAAARYASEVVPEPGDDASLLDLTRYHVARALGFWRGFMDAPIERVGDRTLVVVAQSQVALLLVALHDGLSGEEAARWAFDRCHDGDAGEWLWAAGERLGIDPNSIKGYEVRT